MEKKKITWVMDAPTDQDCPGCREYSYPTEHPEGGMFAKYDDKTWCAACLAEHLQGQLDAVPAKVEQLREKLAPQSYAMHCMHCKAADKPLAMQAHRRDEKMIGWLFFLHRLFSSLWRKTD